MQHADPTGMPVCDVSMPLQVANVRLNKNNIAELWLVEMPVSKVKLAFRDRDTRQLQDKSNTDPQYLQRHLLTRPGQV